MGATAVTQHRNKSFHCIWQLSLPRQCQDVAPGFLPQWNYIGAIPAAQATHQRVRQDGDVHGPARCPSPESVSYKFALPKASTLLISKSSMALRKCMRGMLWIWLFLSLTVFCLFSLTSASWELMRRRIRFQLNMCFTVLKCTLLNRVNTSLLRARRLGSLISIKEHRAVNGNWLFSAERWNSLRRGLLYPLASYN